VDLSVETIPRLPEEASHWRRVALIAGGVAAIELIVLLVVALAFVAKPFAHSGTSDRTHTTGAAATSSAATQARAATTHTPATARKKVVARIPRGRTGVVVLNGNGQYGAASEKAIVVRGLDYPVVHIGDARHRDYPRTIVMYRQGFAGEGYRLARDLGLPRVRVVPLDGLRPSELSGAKLALVIGHIA